VASAQEGRREEMPEVSGGAIVTPSPDALRIARAIMLNATATEIDKKALEIDDEERDRQNTLEARYLYELRDKLIVAAVSGMVQNASFDCGDAAGRAKACCVLADAVMEARKR
jgi:hypothetical protein